MTIFEAKSLLFNFFCKNSVFDSDKNFKEVVPISENEEIDKAIVITALQDMCEAKLVRQIVIGRAEFGNLSPNVSPVACVWVLIEPLINYTQTVKLSFPTVLALIEILQAGADQYKNPTLNPDPLGIQEKDIQNLLLMYGDSLKSNS